MALLAAAACLQALGVSALVRAALVSPSSRASGPRRRSHAGQSEPRSGDAILERNPFDSLTGRLTPQPSDVPDIASKIRKLSDGRFLVERAAVDALLEYQAALNRSRQFVWGSMGGVRVFGVRPGTPLALFGIKNGDRLDSVNGLALGSPEQALEAFSRLRTTSRLHVEIVRRAGPLSIDYVIR